MKLLYSSILAIAFMSSSCKPDNVYTGDCFVPDKNVSLTINMNLPEYFKLQNLGDYLEFDNTGNRGIYVIHNFDDMYYAIERTCTYKSDNECARVTLDNDLLQLRCGEFVDTTFVRCCGSTYNFNSAFITGPTICNLKTYPVNISGNTLYVGN